MPFFFSHKEKMKCPYRGCSKSFNKPTVLTDLSAIPRQTFYACPYCMSKLDVVVENSKVVDVKSIEYPKVFKSPAKCAHYSRYQNVIPRNVPIPDECLVCPKALQCNLRKR